ncbi:MAG: HPF/RaiA family ribosome-associated protein [Polyangiaceae bacterium]|nr:HPF/RaiA family ribosome-associated protein [Polyangiaceae bacterium]
MNVNVRFHGVPRSEHLRIHTTRRVAFGLGRYSPEVSAVLVRIEDVNGPRGGMDQRCHVSVSGPRVGRLEVEDFGTNPYAVVSAAVERIARATGRRLERARSVRDHGVGRRRGPRARRHPSGPANE